MSVMMHKGYAARIEFDADDHVFVGRLTGITDIVAEHLQRAAALVGRKVQIELV